MNFISVSSYAGLMVDFDPEILNITGLPAEGGTGCRLFAPNRFAILEGTGSEEAAWTFMRWFLQEDLQNIMMYLPVRQSVLNAKPEKARLEGELTEEQIALLRKTPEDIEGPYYDDMLHPCYALIYQELRDFFSGRKDSAETSASISSKMAIYLAERG